MESTGDQGLPRFLPQWKSLKIGRGALITQKICYWDYICHFVHRWWWWMKHCFHPAGTLWVTFGNINKCPPHWQNVHHRWQNLLHIWGRICQMSYQSAHHRRQCWNYWVTAETIHTSNDALATHNKPGKYQSPTAESVPARASFRKSDRKCPGLRYWWVT